jgi:hypothetical protein
LPSRNYRRAAEDPAILARLTDVLAGEWDPAGAVRMAAGGGADFYAQHALALSGMMAADARETEVQRYLRQVEQAALGESLHPFDVRRALVESVWRLVHGL